MMKVAVVIALALVSSPAAAKTWVDATCQLMLESSGTGDFTYSKTDGTFDTVCRVDQWPTDQETATMACGDNAPHTMKIVGEAIDFDGNMLLPKGHKDILCD